MLESSQGVSETIRNRREDFIEVLREHSDTVVNRVADERPVPPNNATGDPMELLSFFLQWLNESIRRILQHDLSTLTSNDEIRACNDAAVVANRLRDILNNDFVPEFTEGSRCINGHLNSRLTRVFLQIPLFRRYESFSDAVEDFFKPEEIERACNRCGVQMCKAQKGYRIEQFPEKVLAIGITHGLIPNQHVINFDDFEKSVRGVVT